MSINEKALGDEVISKLFYMFERKVEKSEKDRNV